MTKPKSSEIYNHFAFSFNFTQFICMSTIRERAVGHYFLRQFFFPVAICYFYFFLSFTIEKVSFVILFRRLERYS